VGTTVQTGVGAARHTFEPHVSEVQVHVEGASLSALFAEAGLALAEIMAGGVIPPPGDGRETVHLSSPDPDALLVDWLNELLFRSERARRVFAYFTIEHIDEHSLRAEIRAARGAQARTPVKAATFHGLHIAQVDGGYEAQVVLDV
jgi:SHS2 domain-containing protein